MALKRTKPRRTITMGGFSFADGNVELVHPEDVPYSLLIGFVSDETALEQYFAFSFSEGVLDEGDLAFLLDVTADEALEIAEQLQEHLAGEPDTGTKQVPTRDKLSASEEAEVKKFEALLNGLIGKPEESPTEAISDEIDKVLGDDKEEGDGFSPA